jgi:hypothetical protein
MIYPRLFTMTTKYPQLRLQNQQNLILHHHLLLHLYHHSHALYPYIGQAAKVMPSHTLFIPLWTMRTPKLWNSWRNGLTLPFLTIPRPPPPLSPNLHWIRHNQGIEDKARKTHLGPLHCTSWDMYGHISKSCPNKYIQTPER